MKKRKIKLDRQIEKTAIFIVLFANAYSMLRIMIWAVSIGFYYIYKHMNPRYIIMQMKLLKVIDLDTIREKRTVSSHRMTITTFYFLL